MLREIHYSYFGCHAPRWWTVIVIMLGVMPLSYIIRHLDEGAK